MKNVFKFTVIFSSLLLVGFAKPNDKLESPDCTGITLKSANGAFIHARTMEWGAFDMQPELLVFIDII